MGHHLTENPEAKVFAILSRNPNSRPETKGDQTLVCDHCKHRGRRKDECWFLHSYLRPVGPRRKIGRQGERQGGYRPQPKKGLSVEKEGEGTESNRPESNSVIKINRQLSLDQMQQLMEQLSVLLTQDKGKTKTNGTFINSLKFSNNNQWILDSGATDHMTGNESLLHSFRKYDIK
jgi:hypothetical protein